MPPPPIIAASQAANKLEVRKLCEKDPGIVHTAGQNGNSPLHVAVAKESAANIAVVKILLEFNASPMAENDFGDTPLSVAQSKNHGKLIPLLEEAAAAAAAAEAEAKKAKAAKLKKGKEDGAAAAELVYRRTTSVGWKPLKKDWTAIVDKRKPLTDDLSGKKIAISFSNKAADAAFAKGLDAALKEAGAETRQLNKFPVGTWVQACVWAADTADFVIVLHSANYDDGHYCIAERFLVKESNVAHVVFEIDAPGHIEYTETPADAMALLKGSVALSQKERVDTNTSPSTLSPNALTAEDKAAYSKITKVWAPKEGSSDAHKIDLEQLADQQLAEAAAKVAVSSSSTSAAANTKVEDALEVEELKSLFAS